MCNIDLLLTCKDYISVRFSKYNRSNLFCKGKCQMSLFPKSEYEFIQLVFTVCLTVLSTTLSSQHFN